MSKKLFSKIFVLLLVVGLLFAATQTVQAQTATTYTVCAEGCDFTTIQTAITAASAGDTITVAAGTYEENIVINKPLTLIGPNHEIAGDSVARVDEAIILNSVELGTNIKIESTDVLVKGFFLEGNEKARNGIWFNEQYTENTDLNITIQNNKIIKMGNDGSVKEERGRGIYFTNPIESSNPNLRGKPYVYGIDISYNYVQYAEGGIVLRDNVYANIGYNKVENANEGIMVEWVQSPIDPLLLDEHTVHHNNVIVHDDYGWNENTGFAAYYPDIKPTLDCIGIRLNIIGGTAKVIAKENTISAANPTTNVHSGFNVASLNQGYAVLIDNIVNNTRDGIRLWGTQESGNDTNPNPLLSQNFQVFGGEINGGVYGIHITDWYYRSGYDETTRGTVGLQNRVYLDGNLQISGQSGHKVRIFNDNIDYRDVTVKLGMNLVTNFDFDNPDDVEKVNEYVYLKDSPDPNQSTAEIFIIKLVAKNGNDYYTTIQAAIDAAADGDTILVAAGTYAELLTIIKPLTLLGPNAGIDGTTGTRNPEAVITFPEGDNSSLSLMDAESADITIDGFTFTNDRIENIESGVWDLILVGENIEFVNNRVISQAQRKIPFKIQGPFIDSSDPANNYAGAVVKNNYFESPNTLWNTVIMQGIGATVQYNTIIGGTSGIQIQPYTNTAGGIVSHNNIAGYSHAIWHNYQIDGNGLWIYENNNLGAPIPLTTYYHYGKGTYWQGIVVQTQTPNIEVRNNTINGENDDYTLDTGDLYERTSLGVSYYSGLYPESQIYVHDNEFVNVDQNVENQTPALGNLDEVFANNTFERSAYVENSYLIYTSIQDAIAAASDGDTILVGPGTYVEEGQIVISKNLTIVGADKATTVIKPAQATGSTGDPRGWFLVNTGVEFNLSNVTLDGEGQAIQQAIRSLGTGTIDNNIIKNIKYSQYYGIGVVMMGGNMTISNNTLSNIERIGIMPFGTGVTAGEITGNTYTGKGDGAWLDYGIEVGGGAVVTITGNTISNIGVSSSDWSNAAIMVSDAYPTGAPASVIITDNNLSNNYQGISVGHGDSDGVIVKAEHNDFSGTSYAIDTTDLVQIVDGSPNWFGSMYGPAEGQIIGDVEYIPWCADEACETLAPVFDDAYETDEDTILDVAVADGVLKNEIGVEALSGTVAIEVATDVTNGTLTLDQDGSFTYEPDADFFGEDTFTYIVTVDQYEFIPATVTITVTPVKDQVNAVDDEYETDENITLTITAPGVLANDVDVDLNNMTVGLVTDVEHGALTLNGDGSFVYVPDLDFYGEDSFMYQLVTYPDQTINSTNPWTDTAIVTITVHPVDDDPIVEEIGDQTVVAGDTLTFTVVATDPEGEDLTYSLGDTAPEGATIDPATGEFSWDTTDVEPGDYTFEVCVSDGVNTVCETITVTVEAEPGPQQGKIYLPLIFR